MTMASAMSSVMNVGVRRAPLDVRSWTWGSSLPLLLTVVGAATVTVGSYMAWATFYAGLISRNGVAGHGKYFIGLAAASILAMALSMVPGVSRAIRGLILPAGAAIAFFAIRDLRNLDALIHDPASGFYVPGHGHGLYVVVAGAFILMLAAFTNADLLSARPIRKLRTTSALAAVTGVAMLVPAIYGEYYMHVAAAAGHVHNHNAIFNPTHTLNAAGAILLLAAVRLWIAGVTPRRNRAPRPAGPSAAGSG
jgi:hypothetical protein